MSISRTRATRTIAVKCPVREPFWRLIVSRQFAVLFTVTWTRCGREPVQPHDKGSAMIDTVKGCLTGA